MQVLLDCCGVMLQKRLLLQCDLRIFVTVDALTDGFSRIAFAAEAKAHFTIKF